MTQQVYRKGASVLVLRTVPAGGHEVLLVHKPRKHDAWQLPQGGVEPGETLKDAALRELREETALDGCTVLLESDRVYRYDFPPSYRRFRPDNVKGQEIGFIVALAPAGAEVQVDGKEIDGFAWVAPGQLPSRLRREEYRELAQALYQEALRMLG
jgi:putative (di)nucleoside polyphosphate hydrolase